MIIFRKCSCPYTVTIWRIILTILVVPRTRWVLTYRPITNPWFTAYWIFFWILWTNVYFNICFFIVRRFVQTCHISFFFFTLCIMPCFFTIWKLNIWRCRVYQVCLWVNITGVFIVNVKTKSVIFIKTSGMSFYEIRCYILNWTRRSVFNRVHFRFINFDYFVKFSCLISIFDEVYFRVIFNPRSFFPTEIFDHVCTNLQLLVISYCAHCNRWCLELNWWIRFKWWWWFLWPNVWAYICRIRPWITWHIMSRHQ